MIKNKEFKEILKWDTEDIDKMTRYINFLENYNVFFSAPLDIDFLMLETYENTYKNLLSPNEGPIIKINNSKFSIKDIYDSKKGTEEYKERIKSAVRETLKKCGKDGSTYTDKQKELMIWYTYFFLNRGKPSTHIEFFSSVDKNTLSENIPPVFNKIIDAIKKELKCYNLKDEEEL